MGIMNPKYIFIILIAYSVVLFAGETSLTLRNFEKNKVYVKGFVLKKNTVIHIEALGAGEHIPHPKLKNYHLDPSGMFVYAWILNTQTRKVVWRMTVENTEKVGSAFLRKFNGNIELPAGEYELYFSTAVSRLIFKRGFFSFGDILDLIFEGKNWYEEGLNKWYVKVQNIDGILKDNALHKEWERIKNAAIISLTDVKSNDFREFQFEVEKSIPIRIYAIGEGIDGKMYDYSRITNMVNDKTIWEMKEWDSEHAGGALKNRKVEKVITLKKGKYSLKLYSDDTHYPGNWNANPPFDPVFYGVTLWSVHKEDRKYVQGLKNKKIKAAITITRVGNNAYIEKIFRVKKKTKIRLLALGEGRNQKMYDYAWLDDVQTNERIWVMTYDETKHAGGSSKNRMVETEFVLMPGLYRIGYKTDDSHSYEGWNAPPPYNPTLWGVSIYPYEQNAIEVITNGNKVSSKYWNIQIIRVGDDQHRFKKFTLKKLSKITIYAIGEGDDNEMFDYAWIENMKTHKIEWKMLYENTEWAGGARKNRKIRDEIYLPPGNYLLHFKTDDSHSFEEWNDDPPDDMGNYGVSIKIEEVQ